MVEAIIKELHMRQDYNKGEKVESIYFGGGTPSILSELEIIDILNAIKHLFDIEIGPEITLEANPEDLTLDKLKQLRSIGINRLSIGIQTFDEGTLQFMNRAHNAYEAELSLKNARMVGFDNISTDLIFAVPPVETTVDRFSSDLQRLIAFDPEHISLYSLTIEPKTVFGKRFDRSELAPVDDEINAIQYEMAIDQLTGAGYEHYEVSNFGKPNLHSRHNSSYWLSQNYLGVGPGAHSFNGLSRGYNISNNAAYLNNLRADKLAITEEKLSRLDQVNEYILTRIRTKWGISFDEIQQKWDIDLYGHQPFIDELIDRKQAVLKEGTLQLTSRGLCLADEIALQFFSTE